MIQRAQRAILLLLFAALLARFGGIFLTESLGFNPFAGGQVDGHADRAEEIANNFGQVESDIRWTSTAGSERWAPFLAIFWLLPGPSQLYAQISIAFVGTVSIYNVFIITRHYHSNQAGLLAAIPLAFFPTYIFMHSVLQREAAILFLLTTAFILIFLPVRYIRTPINYVLGAGCVFLAGHLRLETLPVYIVIIGVVVLTAIISSKIISRTTKFQVGVVMSGVGLATIYLIVAQFISNISEVVDYFANLRARRARGRATYLPEAIPSSFLELIAFSWIGAIYFLFAPFPWHFETTLDIGGLVESIIGIAYALFAVLGVFVLKKRTLLGTLALVSLIILFSVLFGFGTANYGTAVRHRQTVFWAIFILGAIGFSSKVQFKT